MDRFSMGLDLRDGIWQDLEEMDVPAVERLLDDLECAVSNGYFGVASEISDQLRSRAAHLLDTNPTWPIRLELELMKRLSYMNYRKPTIQVADTVLEAVDRAKNQIDPAEAGLWKFTVLGYKAWLETAPEGLSDILSKCATIVEHYPENSYKTILQAFLYGLQGRLYALKKEEKEMVEAFERGIQLLTNSTEHRYRSLAHLQVRFAEHLASIGRWDRAIQEGETFLKRALEFGFKSHLRIRTTLFLLRAPQGMLTPESLHRHRVSCWVLAHAMGLSCANTVYPLLTEAAREISRWNIFEMNLDLRAYLKDRLCAQEWDAMERVLRTFYHCEGFQVEDLPEGHEALEFLAIKYEHRLPHCIGVQVKQWKDKVYKDDVPRGSALKTLAAKLREKSYPLPQTFHWYVASGIHQQADKELRDNIEFILGISCQFVWWNVDSFIDEILMSKPETISRIVTML
jgi:tetratricopeptide (TPR) repeat protein